MLLAVCLHPLTAHSLLPAWEQETLPALGSRLTLLAMTDLDIIMLQICVSHHDDLKGGQSSIIMSVPADEEREGIVKLKPKTVSRPKLSDLQGAFADAAT